MAGSVESRRVPYQRQAWKRWMMIAAMCTAPVLSFAQDGSENSNSLSGRKPEIVFPAVRLDMGDVYRGQRVQRSFPFRNSGKGNLEIRSIHSACGCINTKADPKSQFAPGEEGRITFDFDSSWFAGSVVRTITVDSNDPENPATILSVVAKVNEEIHVAPALISLGEIPKDATSEHTLTVDLLEKAKGEEGVPAATAIQRIPAEFESIKKDLSTPSNELRILAAVPSSPQLQVEILNTSGSTRTLKLRLKGPLPSGPMRERITLWNTSTHLKELVIPVVGEVVSHVRSSTRYLEFGAVRANRRSKRTVNLQSDLNTFNIETVKVELRPSEALKNYEGAAVLSHSIQKSNNGYSIALEMKVPSGMKFTTSPVNVSGTVIVKTNDADVKELKIPFFGVLQQEKKQ